jgi:hypothetical protein
VGLALASVAQARIQGYYCGNPNSLYRINSHHRCPHHPPHALTQVRGTVEYPDNLFFCAMSKEGAAGGGHDESPYDCANAHRVISYCPTAKGAACYGYATIINKSDTSDGFFYGYLYANY